MGLDITAYEHVTFVQSHAPQATFHGLVHLYPNPDFVARADGLADGRYRVEGEQHAFRAGSYSGYNEWRRLLASLVGVQCQDVWNAGEAEPAFPFKDLINFSDCEGFIGPKTSAKLACDFKRWHERASSHADTYWQKKYEEWMRAFHIAAGKGVVKFH